jgi:hypothetical protein
VQLVGMNENPASTSGSDAQEMLIEAVIQNPVFEREIIAAQVQNDPKPNLSFTQAKTTKSFFALETSKKYAKEQIK